MVTSANTCGMRTVNFSDLKAQLSTHIQLVRNGEEALGVRSQQPGRGSFLAVWEAIPSRSIDWVARGADCCRLATSLSQLPSLSSYHFPAADFVRRNSNESSDIWLR